ncbi:MFS transporter [Rhodococcus sp. SBT000017]|uniref:MFS transporter n=3 Tax=unclassified Rhodococcus (in: high G+C Gram-positive bacteria) TaxID=192944 RepID=UPI001C7DCA6C|nr:MFS transporter [Rhodococcus sp. SBT000017]
MAVAALLIEGMITDWSALLVSRDFGGGTAVGAAAVVVFSTAMFFSRSFGDLIVDRLGAAVTLRCAAAVVSAAVLLGLLLQPEPWGAVAVMGCAGIALGPLFPLLITEASRRSRVGAAVSTARVSAIGYGAYLGGPPLVGFLAERIGLVGAFVLIAGICSIALVAASISLRDRSRSATP